MTISKEQKVYLLVQTWAKEGRSLPGYVFANTDPYLGYLLGIWNGPLSGPWGSVAEHLQIHDNIIAHSPNLYDLLLGPHGWTIMQALIARKGLK